MFLQEFPVDIGPASAAERSLGAPLATAWSGEEHPLLAVSTEGGRVAVFLQEGEPLPGDGAAYVQRRGQQCRVLAWNPRSNVLACGWRDGTVTVWSERDRRARENAKAHAGEAVTLAAWSPDGSRLVTGDAAGTLCVWRLDHRGAPSLVSQFANRQAGALTACAFRAPPTLPQDAACPPFFFGGERGRVYFADDGGRCSEVVNVGMGLNSLFYAHHGDYLAMVTVDVVLHTFRISPKGKMVRERQVKLSIKGDGSDLRCVWAGPDLLAAANSEPMLRLWHLVRDDSYVLPTPGRELVRSVAYHAARRTLAAGTASGRVCLWRFAGKGGGGEPSDDDWEALPSVDTGAGDARAVDWTRGLGECQLAVRGAGQVSVLAESRLHHVTASGGAVTATQQSASQVALEWADGSRASVTAGVRVRGLHATAEHLLVWSGARAEVYSLAERGRPARVAEFATRATAAAVAGGTVYAATESSVDACNLQGVVKKSFAFGEGDEGVPLGVDACGTSLAVVTDEGVLKMWDLSRREPRQVLYGRRFEDLGRVRAARVNCAGTKVALLCHRLDPDNGAPVPDTRLHVYDVELDRVFSHEFGPGRHPASAHWDGAEPMLLAVDAAPEVVTMFATSEDGLLMQDSFAPPSDGLLSGIAVPYVHFTRPGDEPRVTRHTMRDFVGMDHADEATRRDLMQFSYYLAVGNMDEAYRAVKNIQSASIWENMARMCVKTGRLDAAPMCLGNMGNARGAMALREAVAREPEPEAHVAALAIELGMLDDAERLYRACGRFDLLTDLFQSMGMWDESVDVCEKNDRIHLKTVHYQYAQHLEALGDVTGAVQHYESSLTQQREVPRMLCDLGRVADLQQYVRSSGDPKLATWWAQYRESQGSYEEALRHYVQAGDRLAEVRVRCFMGDAEGAAAACRESDDRAACFHLARQLEAAGRVGEAIEFFKRSRQFAHAMRLARDRGLDAELLSLALESGQAARMEAAAYFEAKGPEGHSKAVLLYQKGGDLARALELAEQTGEFQGMRGMLDDLPDDADPALLRRCAEVLARNGEHEGAAQMLVAAGDSARALEVCVERNVKISEEMAERMTPAKGGALSKDERSAFLKRLGKCLRDQGSFHQACRKYTQAGDKVRAMKCLLRSGDTERISYYASMSRKPQVYVLAANYLQGLDWRGDEQVMRTIVTFYSKAKALAQLSAFYEACAQVEIDEYRAYDKALTAVREAMRHLIQATDVQDKERRLMTMEWRAKVIERFVQMREMARSDPEQMLLVGHDLLQEATLDSAVRAGDVFACMIEHYHGSGAVEDAWRLMEGMRERGIALGPYLDAELVRTVYASVGHAGEAERALAGANAAGAGGAGADEDDDGLDEELDEELDED